MTDEKVLLEALSSSDFKVSVQDKKQINEEETKTVIENKQQFGEEANPGVSANTTATPNDKKSLLSIVQGMSTEQRKKVIDLLKQNGLGDPLTKEKLIQNAFTVDKTIRENA